MAEGGGARRRRGGRADVAGVAPSPGITEPTAPRPQVVVVVASWGSNWGERAAATRLVAGALALRARVSIVSIEDRSDPRNCQPPKRYDSVFPVHSVAAPTSRGHGVGGLHPQDHLRPSDLIRASFRRQPGGVLPEVAARGLLEEASLPSTDALLKTMALEPDVVVLAGPATFWMGDDLPVGTARPRVVLLPLCGDDPVLSSSAFRVAVAPADAIGAFSHLEFDRIAGLLSGDAVPALQRIEIALPVNHEAAAAGVAGLEEFGRYVLVISAFDDDRASDQRLTSDYLHHVLGSVSVAEVGGAGWVVTSGGGRRFDLPWAPTRINLWRLMARAEVTVDVRPAGPIGRETIESLRLGTPVVVAADSVSAEHAKASNGGLWYRNRGEMVDCVRELVDDEALRTRLGASGEQWAVQHHGDTESFVEATLHLVLGGPSVRSVGQLRGVKPA